ncbi:MAG: cation:proton antiporter [Gemmatimonadetes bacterium]|nr:cation:proton antiporter [Gemmatimonadota bacterium]
MTSPEHFLRDLAVVLVTAGATTVLFQRLRWPVVAGYLVAGVIVGPSVPPSWVSDEASIRLLSELGVILLMFSIGLDFRLGRLARAGATGAVAAVVEIGLMLALGFAVAGLSGWSPIGSLFFGGAVAASSTMVIAKVLEEHPVEPELRETVFQLTLFEDLGAMLIIALLTAAASGEGLSGGALAAVVGRLVGMLVLFLVVGLALVPRAARAIIGLRKPETMLVSMVGFAFLMSSLAGLAGFSVALGAFLGGLLVAESGAGRLVEQEIRPLRDVFAAIFFVATGMQLDLRILAESWGLALAMLGVVLLGRPVAITVGVFLSGRSLRTAVRAGLFTSQIGEFSFILAGVGAGFGVVPPAFVAAAVTVSVITALLSGRLARAADPIAQWVDARLPHRVQMVASLYGAWVEALRTAPAGRSPWASARRSARWLALDAVVVAGLVIGGAWVRHHLAELLLARGVSATLASWLIAGVTAALVSPFLFGILRITRGLGEELAEIAIPGPGPGRVDNGRAPRRVLGVAVQIVAVLLTAVPLLLVTAPVLPPLGGLLVLLLVLGLLGIVFWRRTTDLFGHFRAGAEVVVAMLAKQSHAEDPKIDLVRSLLPGLGDFAPVRVGAGSECAGRTLGELNLRGRTGATVVGLLRGEEQVAFPEAHERLAAGDLVALTGSHDAIDAATIIITGEGA